VNSLMTWAEKTRTLLTRAGITYILVWCDDGTGVLRAVTPRVMVFSTDEATRHYVELSAAQFSFGTGVGLPGRTQAKQKMEWIGNVQKLSSALFLRHLAAKQCNIRGSFAFPLSRYVIEFGSSAELPFEIALEVQEVYNALVNPSPTLRISKASTNHMFIHRDGDCQVSTEKRHKHPDKHTRQRLRRARQRQYTLDTLRALGPVACIECGVNQAVVKCWHSECRDKLFEVFCYRCFVDIHRRKPGCTQHWPPLPFGETVEVVTHCHPVIEDSDRVDTDAVEASPVSDTGMAPAERGRELTLTDTRKSRRSSSMPAVLGARVPGI